MIDFEQPKNVMLIRAAVDFVNITYSPEVKYKTLRAFIDGQALAKAHDLGSDDSLIIGLSCLLGTGGVFDIRIPWGVAENTINQFIAGLHPTLRREFPMTNVRHLSQMVIYENEVYDIPSRILHDSFLCESIFSDNSDPTIMRLATTQALKGTILNQREREATL